MGKLACTLAAALIVQSASAQTFKDKCEALSGSMGVEKATFVAAGKLDFLAPSPISITAPDHCQITGALDPRTGIDGKPYAIGYELRLPADWNGKFMFQGGGGSDGVVRPAIGVQATGEKPALSRGYAIVSTDAGHRDEPGPLGAYLFGLDPQARIDKGYYHIPVVTEQARSLIGKLYGKPPTRSYFVGCSNGGRQGMAATQRYPDLFDGVIAGAPAYRVPRAAIEAIFDVQTLVAVAPKGTDGRPDLGAALSAGDLKTLSQAIVAACDASDGVSDGMVNNTRACRFDVMSLACTPGRNEACLAPATAQAIDRIFKGVRLKNGEMLYSDWPYDPGIANPGWTVWKMGAPGKMPPDARNVSLIPGSVAYYFSSPPDRPTDLYDYTLAFDIERGVKLTETTSPPYSESGWSIEGAPSTDVAAFKAHGGKMIFFHGMADPIFSANDTVAYLNGLAQRFGSVDDFARLYLVPGMNHCAGGPATDQFDALSALDNWVELDAAPQSLLAKARAAPGVPWPGRTRPLCPYPSYAAYGGRGSIEDAANFVCK
jgi:poly(3-hydroxybutyrate) depolymerase